MEKASSATQSGSHGSHGASDNRRRLGITVVMQITQDDHLAIARRKRDNGTPHLLEFFLFDDVVQD
jgi:hypothetical protein